MISSFVSLSVQISDPSLSSQHAASFDILVDALLPSSGSLFSNLALLSCLIITPLL